MADNDDDDEVIMVSNDITLEDRFLEEGVAGGGRSFIADVGFLEAKVFSRSCNFCFW